MVGERLLGERSIVPIGDVPAERVGGERVTRVGERARTAPATAVSELAHPARPAERVGVAQRPERTRLPIDIDDRPLPDVPGRPGEEPRGVDVADVVEWIDAGERPPPEPLRRTLERLAALDDEAVLAELPFSTEFQEAPVPGDGAPAMERLADAAVTAWDVDVPTDAVDIRGESPPGREPPAERFPFGRAEPSLVRCFLTRA